MRIRDAALPTGLAAVVAAVALAGADSDDRALAPWGWALILTSAAALLWRRRHPIPVLLVTGAACVAYYPLGFPDTPIAVSLVVALYTVARERGPVPSGAAAAGLLLVVTATASAPLPTAASVAPLLALPVVLGEVIRGRAHQTTQAEERATLAETARNNAEAAANNAEAARNNAETAQRNADEARQNAEAARRSAEASREAEALRRATEERLRISREVHDALGHQLSLISVQAGAALHTRSVDGAFAALQAIRTASGDALRELREVLGVLREPVRPALAALPELLDRTSATGLTVRSAIEVPDPPPAAVQQAAYRIVQEAITNAVRHATAATTIDVAIHLTPIPAASHPPAHPAPGTQSHSSRHGSPYPTPDESPHTELHGRADAKPHEPTHTGPHLSPRSCGSASDRWLVAVVENDGAEVATMAEGNGIRGMAERAAALGGNVTAGPRPCGGFRVEARLPVDKIETDPHSDRIEAGPPLAKGENPPPSDRPDPCPPTHMTEAGPHSGEGEGEGEGDPPSDAIEPGSPSGERRAPPPPASAKPANSPECACPPIRTERDD
ncbi:sensor histidine kinase [Actinoplanes xinjiangensis]|uniref:histidine kinase n=1 Tax=Actinoplanes xinjiangensis TaxID=512350 RepID=A0A316FIM1_9ACTN|nr:histidine kinase [Actinoplanes xinjiangensis]PWK47576.1 histidine kinase [Actinoplanes xinjiangensis]GIF39497.1 hypothetical protein Axi01nite_38080 [Actinoplanes xinjiangensis]